MSIKVAKIATGFKLLMYRFKRFNTFLIHKSIFNKVFYHNHFYNVIRICMYMHKLTEFSRAYLIQSLSISELVMDFPSNIRAISNSRISLRLSTPLEAAI